MDNNKEFGKLKVSVAFQNHFGEVLEDKAKQAMLEWLVKHNIPAVQWSGLISIVNGALYTGIKECMDRNGTLIELFSQVPQDTYCKRYSRGYLKSWTKSQLIEEIECLQHNCAVTQDACNNQMRYFEKCVLDEVKRRLNTTDEEI